jgi:hypothetical protein
LVLVEIGKNEHLRLLAGLSRARKMVWVAVVFVLALFRA